MPAIALRQDYDAARVRALARASRDARQVRRLLALAAVYDGARRREAAAPGTPSPTSPGASCPWASETGPMGIDQRRLV